MGLVFILQLLVVGLCSRLGHGATLDACMLVLLSEEFHTTCSTLGSNHTRPCLVRSDEDVVALKKAKVIGHRMSVPRNKICAARTETGEADCVSVHLTCSSQQNHVTTNDAVYKKVLKLNALYEDWQWTEWTGTSPNIARRFTITEGNTNRLCPYVERYFVPESFSDCLDALNQGMTRSGVYKISPDGSTELQVYCNMDMDGGGWTVIQRRQDGQEDFYRTWNEYKVGFGDLEGEFWLGNDNIHLLTQNNDQQVKFHMRTLNGESADADYSQFSVDSASLKYKLHILGYLGTAIPGDSMIPWQNGHRFSTPDQDNTVSSSHCADRYNSAWWYGAPCHQSNLNGVYGSTTFGEGINWFTWKGYEYSMACTAIMVRRK